MVYRLTHPARRARENSRQVVSRQCFAWTYSGSATFTRFWLRIVWHVGVWNPILQKNVDVSKQTCLVHESVTWYRKLWEMSCQVSRNVSRHCVPPLSRHCGLRADMHEKHKSNHRISRNKILHQLNMARIHTCRAQRTSTPQTWGGTHRMRG